MSLAPEEVLGRALERLPDGSVLTGAIVILTYVLPAEDDEDDRGPFLALTTDTHQPIWTHLGMVESAAGDMRSALSSSSSEDE